MKTSAPHGEFAVTDDRSRSRASPRDPRLLIALLEPREAASDYVLSLAMGLRETGTDLFVIATPQLRTKLDALMPRPDVEDLPYFSLTFAGGWRNGFPYVRGWIRTLVLLARRRPDALHVQWLIRPAVETRLLPLLTRLIGARLVYTAHNVLPHEEEPGAERVYGAFYQRCDEIVVHTQGARRRLLELWPNVPERRVSVVPHGNHVYRLTTSFTQDDARHELGLPTDRPTVLFIGKIRPYKGVLDLISAFDHVRTELGATLLIAGHPDDADYLREVQSAIARRARSDIHLLAAYLSDRQMQMCFAAADVVALPYHAIDQSGILLYAMTHGKAIVASRLEGFVEVFDDLDGVDKAVFHTPHDIDGLQKALLRVLRNREMRARMGSRARELALANHSWPAIAYRMESIYAGVRHDK